MSVDNAILIQRARAAIKSGDQSEARALLRDAVRQNVRDPLAWAWLAAVTSSPETSLKYARRAAQLDGSNALVKKVNTWAERRAAASAAPDVSDQAVGAVEAKPKGASWQSVTIWGSIGLLAVVLVALAGALTWNTTISSRKPPANEPELRADQETIADAEVVSADAPVVIEATPERELPSFTPTSAPPRIQAKNITSTGGEGQGGEPRPTWTTTPTPTNTPVPTPTYVPTFVSPQNSRPVARPFGVGPEEHWIDVDLTAQQLVAYEGNKAVFHTLVSSGTWQHPTVTGQFRIWVRYRSQTMDGRRLGYDYYLENVPYVMYFFEDYALHGTYWHNNFGTPMSHGCVNLKTSDSEWIYNWSSLGTVVNVHY